MAVNKRNRVYRLTPRRKAALHKAQLASARKRSRRGRVALGVVGATIVAGGLTYAGHRHLKGRSGKTNVVSHTTKSVKAVSSPTVSQTVGSVSQKATHSAPNVVTVTLSASKELDLIRVQPTKNGNNWRIVGKAFKKTEAPKKVRHVMHDRMWTHNRKQEARRARRATAERRRYRLRQQANGRWRTK